MAKLLSLFLRGSRLCSGRSRSRSQGLGILAGWQLRRYCGSWFGIDLLQQVIVLRSCFRNENSRKNAEQGYYSREDPGASFQHIGSLFHTHELVAQSAYITCQSTTFGVLHQDDETQDHTGH